MKRIREKGFFRIDCQKNNYQGVWELNRLSGKAQEIRHLKYMSFSYNAAGQDE